ncbi:MAG: hypothetical protein ACOZBZ_04235 [Patescibacteria group bacterium]
MRKTSTKTLISQAFKNPKYAGKHLVVIKGKIFATKTGKAQVSLLDKLVKKYPKETPTILYVPKADTLILLL